jgi:protoporphyrinogen oxidase
VSRLLPGTLKTNTPVSSVSRDDQGFVVNGEKFDRVLSTIPLNILGALLPAMPADVSSAFKGLDHCSLMTVFLGLKKSDAPPHSWIYFPHSEDGPQNRITWLSNYSPKNAPEGGSSIMAEVTYYGNPPGSDSEVTEQVLSGLVNGGFLSRDEVVLKRVWHNKFAYILYRHGHEDRLAAIRDFVEGQGIDLAGRFGNYQYFNSDRCIRDAWDVTCRYPSVS